MSKIVHLGNKKSQISVKKDKNVNFKSKKLQG